MSSIIIRGLQLAVSKLNRDLQKQVKAADRADKSLDLAQLSYAERVSVAHQEYRRALAKAAKNRDLSLSEALEDFTAKSYKYTGRSNEAHYKAVRLGRLTRKLDRVLDQEDEEEQLKQADA